MGVDRRTPCPVCEAAGAPIVVELHDVPTQDGVLWNTREEALGAPTGDIGLRLCQTCSYLWNDRHDPAKVSFAGYDVSLQHSPAFRDFVDELCSRLASTYPLEGASVLEIGCGRGFFLERLCRRIDGTGLGFDPSYRDDGEKSPGRDRLQFVPEPFGEEHAGTTGDLVVCRHVLDIIPDPRRLLEPIARSLSTPDALAYVEVPDARHTFGDRIPWNLVYEHRSWFVRESLEYLVSSLGFYALRVEPCWHDEYLGVDARRRAGDAPAPAPSSPDDNGFGDMVNAFADDMRLTRARWSERVSSLRRDGRRVVIWGAGARAIGFLSLISGSAELVPYSVDINPLRHGLYLPRTAIPVDAPTRLRQDPPDVLLISNPTYATEITDQARALGVTAEIEIV